MRRFDDRDGLPWDVIIGRESWGVHFALFVPASGEGDVRQTVLRAATFDEALAELEAITDAGLQQLLDVSTVKEG